MYATVVLALCLGLCQAACFQDTAPWTRRLPIRSDVIPQQVLRSLNHKLDLVATEEDFHAVSFSASATTLNGTFWSYHHTARLLDWARPGAHPVSADSYYRIASITKMFTTTAILQLHGAGKLHLDDPVLKHLPKLEGVMPWQDITLRMLLSQSSGLGRDWSQGDLTRGIENLTGKGFPPPTKKFVPSCYENSDFMVVCNETDLYNAMPHQYPVFAPNQVGSYSNAAFELLGMVIEKVAEISYSTYVDKHILSAWDLTSGLTFAVPPDDAAVLPKGVSWFFDKLLGLHNPAGGLYATTNGLDKYLRAMMQKAEDPELGAPAVNIFMPESFSFGSSSSYGLTWEIFRTTELLENGRSVTFFTKGGGQPGYITMIAAVPEYGLGITVLCAGDKASKALDHVREVVTAELIRAAEEASIAEVERKYVGRFVFDESLRDGLDIQDDDQKPLLPKLDSSLNLAHDPKYGLFIQSWISNSSDMLHTLDEIFSPTEPGAMAYRLVATGLHTNQTGGRQGEIWRGVPLLKEQSESLWSDFCVNDVDGLHYDGKPFLEFVFYTDEDDVTTRVDIPSFRVRLKRGRDDFEDPEEDSEAELDGAAVAPQRAAEQQVLSE